MAEGAPRLIVFYGTDAERRKFVDQRKLDEATVVLAAHARKRLLGWSGPVDTWMCSGRLGMAREEALKLAQHIRLINNTYGGKS